jgi:hypothetical protein
MRAGGWLRWLLVPIVVLPIGWLLLSGFGRDPLEIASPQIGRAAPAWTLTTLDGEALNSADLVGRTSSTSGPAGAGRASTSTRC